MNPMQLVLIAAGGYLLWRYLQGSGAAVTGGVDTGTGTVTGAGSSTGTGTGAGTGTSTGGTSTTTTGGGGTSTGGTSTTGTGTGSNTGSGSGSGSGTTTPDYASSAEYTAMTSLWAEVPGVVATLPTQYQDGQSYVTAQGAAGNVYAMKILTDNNVLYNIDQWNFWRALTGATAIDSNIMDQLIVGDRSTPITVVEYRRRLFTVGLSGISNGLGTLFNGSVGDWY